MRKVLVGHRAAVNVVDFDEKYIVSASGDRTIKVWTANTCEFVRTLSGHRRGIGTFLCNFLHQSFCIFYTDNFTFLHQIFLDFIHQTCTFLHFLHQKFYLFAPFFYNKIFSVFAISWKYCCFWFIGQHNPTVGY